MLDKIPGQRLLFFDCETTGMILWKQPSRDPAQPHIMQLAALLTDEHGNKQGSLDVLIRPDGWDSIDPKALEAHGITIEHARRFGVPINDALCAFVGLYEQADLRIGHGENFDARMVRIELMRINGEAAFGLSPDDWKGGKSFCTMKASTNIVKEAPTAAMLAANRRHYKSPTLGEAYRFFAGKEMTGAHSAMGDVLATRKVYFGIRQHEREHEGLQEAEAMDEAERREEAAPAPSLAPEGDPLAGLDG